MPTWNDVKIDHPLLQKRRRNIPSFAKPRKATNFHTDFSAFQFNVRKLPTCAVDIINDDLTAREERCNFDTCNLEIIKGFVYLGSIANTINDISRGIKRGITLTSRCPVLMIPFLYEVKKCEL